MERAEASADEGRDIEWRRRPVAHRPEPLGSSSLRGLPRPWTGFRPLSADGMPIIGRGALEGRYFLTGHGPSGIASLPGSVTPLMALIEGEPPPLPPRPFDPLRFKR